MPETPETHPAPISRMTRIAGLLKKLLRLSIRVVGVLLASLSMILLLIVGAWQSQWSRDFLVKTGVGVASVFLEGEVSVGSVGGDLVNNLVVKNVAWRDRNGKPMVLLERLAVQHEAIAFLWTGKLVVRKVLLSRPQIWVTEEKGGKLNLLSHIKSSGEPAPQKPPSSASGSLPLNLSVKQVKVERLFVHYKTKAFSTKIHDLRLHAGLRIASKKWLVNLRRLSLRSDSPRVALKSLSGQLLMRGSELSLTRGRLRLVGGSVMAFKAKLNLNRGMRLNAAINKLRLTPGDARLLLPAYPVVKELHLTASAGGKLFEGLSLRLDAGLGRAKIRLRGDVILKKKRVLLRTLEVQHLDTGELLGDPTLDSDLHLSARGRGQGFSLSSTESSLEVTLLPSRFQKYKIRKIKTLLRVRRGILTVPRLNIQTPFARIRGARLPRRGVAVWANLRNGSFEARLSGGSPNVRLLGRLFKLSLGGSFSFRANLRGKRWVPKGSVRLSVNSLRVGKIRAKRVQVSARLRQLRPGLSADIFLCEPETPCAKQGMDLSLTSKIKLSRLFGRFRLTRKRGRLRVFASRLGFNFGAGLFSLREQSFAALVKKPPLVQLRGRRLRLQRLGLIWRGRERLSLQGRLSLRGLRPSLKLTAYRLSLAPLLRALGLRRSSLLSGRFSLVAKLRGSFRAPVLGGKMYLERGSFRSFRNIETCLHLGYQKRRLQVATAMFFPKESKGLVFKRPSLRGRYRGKKRKRRKRRLWRKLRALRVSALQRRTARLRRSSCLGARSNGGPFLLRRTRQTLHRFWETQTRALPSHGRFRVEADLPVHVRLVNFPKNPVSNRSPFRLKATLEMTELGWLTRALKIPLTGQLTLAGAFGGTLNSPVVDRLSLRYANLRYKRLGLFSGQLPFVYRGGRLLLRGGKGMMSPLAVAHLPRGLRKNRVVTKGSLFDLSMSLPVRLSLPFHGFVPSFRWRLRNEPLSLRLRLPGPRFRLLRSLLSPRLQRKLSKVSGILDGLFELRGTRDRPRLVTRLSLRDGTFCPWLRGKPVCLEPRSFLHNFRKRRLYRLRNLRFLWQMKYIPEGAGNLTMVTRADWGKKKLLRVHLRELPLRIRLPETLSFRWREALAKAIPGVGRDRIDFTVSVPENLPLGILERIRPGLDLAKWKGNVSFSLRLQGLLRRPRLNVEAEVREGEYIHEFRSRGRHRKISGIRSKLRLRYPVSSGNKASGVLVKTSLALFSKRFLELSTTLGAKVDLSAPIPGVGKRGPAVVLQNRWSGALSIKPFRVERLTVLLPFLEKVRGVLEGTLKWKGSAACPTFTGGSGMRFHSVTLGENPTDSDSPYHLLDSQWRLSSLKDGRTQLEGFLHLPGQSRERLLLSRLWVPFGLKKWIGGGKRLRGCAAEQRDKLKLIARTRKGIPFSPLSAFLPGWKLSGKAFVNVQLGGTFQSPIVKKGQILLTHETIAQPARGIYLGSRGGSKRATLCRDAAPSLRRLKLLGCSYSSLSLFPSHYRVDTNLQGRTGMPFVFKGRVGHRGFSPERLQLDLLSRGFEPMSSRLFRAEIKSSVKIRGTAGAPSVRGVMEIPKFYYTLLNSYGSASKYKQDKDILLVTRNNRSQLARLRKRWEQGRKKSKSRRVSGPARKKGVLDKLALNLVLKIPNNFRLTSKLSNREADLEIKTDSVQHLNLRASNGRMKLFGGIAMVRGGFQAYGKPFTVVKGGTVSFQGQSFRLSNPNSDALLSNVALSIRAFHVVKLSEEAALYKKGLRRVKVTLVIGGTALNPTVGFEVVNAQTEEKLAIDKVNAISLVLVGNTTDSLAQTNVAGQALGLFGSMLTNQLKSAVADVVPLDVLKVQSGANLGDFKVAVGWYLNPLLYLELSFKPAPLEEESLWSSRLDYTLNKHWSFEMKAGFTKRNDSFTFRTSGHLYFKTKR